MARVAGGAIAGFKFRRQHPCGIYCLDFYCPVAKLSVELDGFQPACRNTSSMMRSAKGIWRRKASKNCDFGTVIGGKTAKVCCWKYGMRCTGEPAARP